MKTIIITAFFFMINISVMAQNVKKNTYTTPDVASLASTVKTPVSLSSGSMNIEIPLYTLTEGDVEIPISMIYDATGVRVGSHPGWTGQNWTLKAGGMITRIIKGAPDEARADWDYYNTQLGLKDPKKSYAPGYNWNFAGNSSTDWNSTSKITAFASLVNGVDLEPDEFIFNFLGHSGKFCLDHTNKYRTIGMEGYKIEVAKHHDIPLYDGRKPIWETIGGTTYINDDAYTYCNGDENQYFAMRQARIIGFKITDPYGYVYYFGQYERYGTGEINYYTDNFDGIEITSSFFEQIYDEVYSTWYLMKVVSPKNRKVTFTYENGYPVATFNRSYTMTNMRVQDQASFWNLWSPGYLATYKEDHHMDGSLIRPQNLKSIETENVIIEFTGSKSTALDYDYSLVQYYLDYIAINSYSPDILSAYMYGIWPVADIKVWREYSQHNPNRRPIFGRTLNPNLLKWEKLNGISINWKHGGVNPIQYVFSYRENANERLQLTAIQKKVGSQVVPPYTFQYNNAKKLPSYFDLRTDHWGYYNANSNANNVTDKVAYKEYKNANANYIDSEILQKITYPTGGSKEFIYEPNKYTRVVQRNTSSGAVSIGTTPETIGGGLRIKEIIEKPDLNSESEHRIYNYSDGILNGEIQYYWPNYSGRLANGNTYTSTRFFTHSVLPVSDNSAGGSVSYSTVTETIPGNGKIVRTYSNHDTYLDDNADACIDPQKSAYSPFSSKSELRGKLLTETIYKENNSQPISKTTYTYTPLNQNNYVRSVQTRGYVLFDGVTTNAIEGSAYKIYTDPVQVASIKEQSYPDNSSSPIETITNCTYNDYFDLDTQEVIGSNEGVQTKYKTVTKYVYNCDDADINFSPNYDNYVNRTTLTNRNMLKLPITITSYKNDVFDNKIHARYAYNQNKSDVIYQKFVNKMFGNNKALALFSSFNTDKKGNYMQYYEISNIGTILIWGYNYQYLIAEVKNSYVGEVETALGKTIDEIAASPNPDMTLINSLRAKLKDAQITTYTYNPLVGLKTVTDPNGFVSYYNYDLMGRLSEIRDHNNNLIESYEYHYNQ